MNYVLLFLIFGSKFAQVRGVDCHWWLTCCLKVFVVFKWPFTDV